jgi:hypothetical protein
MPKLTLTDIESGYASVAALNANFTAIETAIENTVSRDGTTPNQMGAALDMNSNNILNVDQLSTRALSLNGSLVTTSDLVFSSFVTPKDFGAVGDGVTDDTLAVQNAIDAAATSGGVVDGRNLTYAISSQLTVAGAYGIVLENINLIAIAGTWPTGATGAMISFTAPTSVTVRHKFYNVVCNCDEIAKSGFYINEVKAATSFINCNAYYFSEKGFWITSDDPGNNDIHFIGCRSQESKYSEDPTHKYNNLAARTAYAWYIYESSDTNYTNCVGAVSLRNLYVDGGGYNYKFVGCTFWAGETRTEATSVTAEIADANKIQFVGCRFDDGQVLAKTFNHQFIGCLFIQFNAASMLTLEASEANENSAGLHVVGCSFDGTTPTALTTTGSGTWTEPYHCVFTGNTKQYDVLATFGGYNNICGEFRYTPSTMSFGVGNSSQVFYLDGIAGQQRYYGVKTNTENRWTWGANTTAETGSLAGSDWVLNSADDDGNYLSTPIRVYRATGNVDLSANLTIKPPSTAQALATNGQVTFELTNNTTLTFKARGSDGTTRSGTVTLS